MTSLFHRPHRAAGLLARAVRMGALCWLATSLALPAFANDAVLNRDGDLYRTVAGTYGQIFGDGAAPTDSPVLALEVTRASGSVEYLLVPGTDDVDGDLEGNSSLLYDDESRNLFVVWESRRNIIHPVLKLAGFDGSQWSEPLTIQSNIFATKGSPRLAVTRDSYSVDDGSGNLADYHRTVLHLVWWEERAEGLRALYAPIVLDEGRYGTEAPTVFALNDLLSSGGSAGLGSSSHRLLQLPVVRSGRDHRSITTAFADDETGTLNGVEVTVLPGEMGFLADEVRAHIIEIGWTGSQQMGVLSDLVRAHIIEIGRHLNPRNLSFVADEVRAHIIEIGRRGQTMALSELATDVRSELIDVGSSIFGDERTRLYAAFEPHDIHEIETSVGRTPVHLLDIKVVSSHPAPSLLGEPSRIFVSTSGEHLLVASEGDGVLHYVETTSDGWSETFSLSLETMSLEEAYALLQQRTDNR